MKAIFSLVVFSALLLLSPRLLADNEKPKMVIGTDGKQKVLIFDQERERSEIGFDVDGNKIDEMLDDRIEQAISSGFVEFTVRVNSKITDDVKSEIQQAAGNGATVSFFEGKENFAIIKSRPGKVKAIAALAYVDEMHAWDKPSLAADYARKYTGLDHSAFNSDVWGNPSGVYSQSSPINGDHDGNINSYSTGDVVVAIIDSGIRGTHEVFANNKIIGWKDIGGKIDPCLTPCDISGHGTHVASIIVGAKSNNYGYGIGPSGVAPGAAIVGVKLFANDTKKPIEVQDLIDSFVWVRDHRVQYNIKVLSLSILGAQGCFLSTHASPLTDIENQLIEDGVTVVVAMGNGTINGQAQTCFFNNLAAPDRVIDAGINQDT